MGVSLVVQPLQCTHLATAMYTFDHCTHSTLASNRHLCYAQEFFSAWYVIALGKKKGRKVSKGKWRMWRKKRKGDKWGKKKGKEGRGNGEEESEGKR